MAADKTSAVRRILVVGQGIAGTLVGFEAMRRGLHVTTIDRGSHCASQVAAGLYNPMSFRRLIPTWDAEVHLETMRETIGAMEVLLGITVLHPTPMWKVLPNAEVAVDWRVKAQTNPMMGPVIPAPDGVMAPHGIGVVADAGWVNLPMLLDAWRAHLQRSDVDANFVAVDLADFEASGGLHDFDVRVDCRGVAVREDTGLAHLEVAAYQGEVLTLKGDAGPDATLNCGKWLLPIGTTTRWKFQQRCAKHCSRKWKRHGPQCALISRLWHTAWACALWHVIGAPWSDRSGLGGIFSTDWEPGAC